MRQEIGRTRQGLRLGYTTGSCAAAAAKAAAKMLFSGEEVCQVRLMTPKGIELYLDVECPTAGGDGAECAVRKYSGDDPDVTDGLLVFARVEKVLSGRGVSQEERILIEGGEGVGRVTRHGLEQDVGEAAINRVPRQMIRQSVLEICRQYGYEGNILVTVSIPEGRKAAKKTFNPRLGIEGGLSVLGTTGIVEPMSEKALTDTIWLELKMLKESGCRVCCMTPGNYGQDFLKGRLGVDVRPAVKCSNFIGETIDYGRLLGMRGMLLIGHAGKLVKLAAGVMNTHSRQADCRMEVLAAHAAMAGAGSRTAREIMDCVSTSEALKILRESGLSVPVMETVMEKIEFHLRQRAGEELEIGAFMFADGGEILGETSTARRLFDEIYKGVRRK